MEKFHTLQGGGADPAFCVHTPKKVVSDPTWTLQIWISTKGMLDPAIGAGDLRLHWGAKGGSDPASGVRPRNWSTNINKVYVYILTFKLNNQGSSQSGDRKNCFGTKLCVRVDQVSV